MKVVKTPHSANIQKYKKLSETNEIWYRYILGLNMDMSENCHKDKPIALIYNVNSLEY